MKSKTLLLVLILICISVVAAPVSFAGGSKKEELHGTWINKEYKDNQSAPFEKHVINPDGTMNFFKTEKAVWETDVEVLENGWIECYAYTYTIKDKWTDSDRNVWYKVEAIMGGYEENPDKAYLLMKISDSNRVLEFMVGLVGYREELDPTALEYHYRKYYRQE